jgi:hypothetical protein
MDMFVEQTHNIDTQMRDGEKPMRFTDTRLDEQERGVSLKMVPMSLVMEGTSGKSYLMNLIDTPGGSLICPMSQLIQALLMSLSIVSLNMLSMSLVGHLRQVLPSNLINTSGALLMYILPHVASECYPRKVFIAEQPCMQSFSLHAAIPPG